MVCAMQLESVLRSLFCICLYASEDSWIRGGWKMKIVVPNTVQWWRESEGSYRLPCENWNLKTLLARRFYLLCFWFFKSFLLFMEAFQEISCLFHYSCLGQQFLSCSSKFVAQTLRVVSNKCLLANWCIKREILKNPP